MPLQKKPFVARAAVGLLFFLQGICFASWASRIPSIRAALDLSDTALGLVLFSLPAGSFIALLFAGSLVHRFGSKRISIATLVLYSGALLLLGLATSKAALIGGLFLFGVAGNTANIAINTQAVAFEHTFRRNVMASFHGLWSLAGFTAAGIGTYFMARGIAPLQHFFLVSGFMLVGVAACFSFLIREEKSAAGGDGKLFTLPDKYLALLGIIAFLCMICEGTMFDWSGIYFEKVVQPGPQLVGAGYTAFMCTMAGGRFLADRVTARAGFRRTVQASALLIASGLLLAVLIPHFYTALAGFLLTGLGVSSVVPLVYSLAGRSRSMSPSRALAAVSSISFLGFLIGPPLIGLVAGALGLRVAFAVVAAAGLSIFFLAAKAARMQQDQNGIV
jgi:MFS family permease